MLHYIDVSTLTSEYAVKREIYFYKLILGM